MAKTQRKDHDNVRLRGFTVRRPDGRFVAICLRPYLVVEGVSWADASTRMQRLIEAYVADAINDGNLDMMLSRKAPLGVRFEYLNLRVLKALNGTSGRTFETTCCIPQHA